MAIPTIFSPFGLLAAGAGAAVVASRFALDIYGTCRDAKKDAQRADFVASFRNNLKNTVDEFKLETDNLNTDERDSLLGKLSQIEAFDRTLQLANTQQGVQEAVIKFGQHYSALKSEIEHIKVEQRYAKKTGIKKAESEKAAANLTHGITSVSATNAIDTSALKEARHIRGSNVVNNVADFPQDILDRGIVAAEALRFYEQIKDMDQEYSRGLESLINELDECRYPQRLQLIRTTMKLHYGQIKELTADTNRFRDMLEKLLHHASCHDGFAEVSPAIEALFSQKYISKEQYNSAVAALTEFVMRAEERLARQRLILQLKDNIESLGYTLATGDKADSSDIKTLTSDLLMRIESEEVVYLDTQWAGYKVMLKLNKDTELTTRLVRVVRTHQETQDISTNQRQRDSEIGKKWCEDYDRFLEKLQQDQLFIGIKLRKEPQEQDILYVVDKAQETTKQEKKGDTLLAENQLTADSE
ncbi:secreted protein [Candidatus Magnetobacterium bavaricum]|uniref:Secreted protein n=1 Tax=Candidatus Magnetobacterium bavaricum TaxID=29290 RepID=A0A0F3H364_9BACT|nr:secreted protein [Candidatus Magnetobacterium bavaricum]